jgi:hypothetical protein
LAPTIAPIEMINKSLPRKFGTMEFLLQEL